MKAFMSNFGPSKESPKEKLICSNLLSKLSESVKWIQMMESVGEEDEILPLDEGDGSSALLEVLEAIFLHGFKDSLFQIASKALSTDPIDQRPEPSFWSFLLVFSHTEIIKQIEELARVNCEVGYSRAWIRCALNDNLLSSYLAAMKRDTHILKQFYKQHAFIRDPELLDVAQNLISGVEAVSQFNLAVNSSLLNYWNQAPLLLAGIWSQSLKSCPVPSGVDIASSLGNRSEVTVIDKKRRKGSEEEIKTITIGRLTALNEGEALRIILQKSYECSTAINSLSDTEIISNLTDSTNTNNSSGIGNSLNGLCGWSSEQNDLKETENSVVVATPDSCCLTEASFNAVLDNYNKSSPFKYPTLDTDNRVYEEQEQEQQQEILAHLDKNTNDRLLQNLGYEVITSNSTTSLFSKIEFNHFESFLSQIGTEKGLDNQRYVCGTCGNTLGISFAKPKVCSYTGEYFCEDCMSETIHIIPARVIFNWDFRKYPISKKSESFIIEFKNEPLINIKVINPSIYSIIETMAELQGLRVQLNFLRAYLYTCREQQPIIEQLQRKIWPREYLYESVHQYSISDIEQIADNQLANQLKEIILFARSHVSSCWLCSQKGFICELCHAPKVLYPFDLNITFRCETCNAVFHRECMDQMINCPKCERRKTREILLNKY